MQINLSIEEAKSIRMSLLTRIDWITENKGTWNDVSMEKDYEKQSAQLTALYNRLTGT